MIKAFFIAAAIVVSSTAAASAAGWTTGSVNFRDGPGAYYAKIGTIARCVRVEIDRSENGWYRVSWNGTWGWVSARYISSDAGYCGSGKSSSGSGYQKPTSSY